MPRGNRRLLFAAALVMAAGTLAERETAAHKSITSPYTYSKDVLPILRERCGQCHADSGPAPMSLLVYENEQSSGAAAWAQAIRDALTSGQMPPWFVDPTGPRVKGGYPITAREMDRLITWAAGGTPKGNTRVEASPSPLRPQSSSESPDVILPLTGGHVLPPGTLEGSHEFVVATGLQRAQWVRGFDLRPGTANVVRSATISTDGGRVLSVWVPGTDPVLAPAGTAFRLDAGARLRVEIFYRKSYLDEQKSVSDLSSVGIFFGSRPAGDRAIAAFDINPPEASTSWQRLRTFGRALPTASRVVAVRPSLDRPYATLKVDSIAPNGVRTPLLWLRQARPEWRRRYWLTAPIDLAAGSRVEVTATALPREANPSRPIKTYPLQVSLDVVSR